MESRFERRYINLKEPVWGREDTGIDRRTRGSEESEFSRTSYTDVKSHDETHYFVKKKIVTLLF